MVEIQPVGAQRTVCIQFVHDGGASGDFSQFERLLLHAQPGSEGGRRVAVPQDRERVALEYIRKNKLVAMPEAQEGDATSLLRQALNLDKDTGAN